MTKMFYESLFWYNKGMKNAEIVLRNAFEKSGIVVGGKEPWDIQVHDARFYDRVLSGGTLGFGESYMDGWWDAGAVDQLIYKILQNDLQNHIKINAKLVWSFVQAKLTNYQKTRAFEVGERHYDIGNDLYEKMLDKRLAYSCGYWKGAKTLDEAQEAKLDLICRKIGLKPGDSVADIGSGWGSFLLFAAEKYGAHGTGVTVSKEQVAYVDAHKGALPVETRLQDYRMLEGTFDHVVSVGMFEHVGYKNHREYMQKVHSILKDDGYFLLHTIGGNITRLDNEPWTAKYIFPHGTVPSIKQIGDAADNLFSMEDWHNFGPDYDPTLMAWAANFDAHWSELKGSYDDRFYRMWKYYLLSCAASFRMRHLQLWQVVFSKIGKKGKYLSVR
ncbi:MAG: Cyclopropane-fatty-acyl-phospholipid synthase [Candidatus Kaiserbacteria bacterium]|nr:Cyclopropane-fatty-acyl-phospholipid synthase [Candidatus Kaiserbacteria bacterium]